MDKSGKLILVTGATGQQGGTVARYLLSHGWQVRALTRDINKPAALVLKQAGAEVVRGDNDDRASLDAAMRGVYGVFSVQNFWTVGADGEIRQGKLIADAAKAAGVQHFVYSSVGSADQNTGIPHFESKWQIEQYIHALGLPATILRPVAFMENYNWSRQTILDGTFVGFGLAPEKKLQIVAVEDIAVFVDMALAAPETYIGQSIDLAGDALTESEIAATFARVVGRPVQVGKRTVDPDQPPDPEMIRMLTWFNNVGYHADIPALRNLHPQLKTLEAWARETGWAQAEPQPQDVASPSR